MPKGGKRIGAGAKPRADSPTITRSVRFTMDEWDKVKHLSANYKTVSDYIRFKALSE